MNSEHVAMRKRASGASMGADWMAIAAVAAIGVIWILPVMALRAGCGAMLALIAAGILPWTLRSQRGALAPIHAS